MGTFGNITSDTRQCAFPGGSTNIQTMALGGTGANLKAIAGGLVYSTVTQLAITPALTGILQGNGAAAPTAFTGTQYGLAYFATASTGGSTLAGTATQVLHGNPAGAPTWSAVALGTDVSGTLPLANGGVGVALTAVNGGLVWSNATTFAITAALTGVVQGNGAAAPTAITGTANYLPKWSATAPYLTGMSLVYDNGTRVLVNTVADPGSGILALNGGLTLIGAQTFQTSAGQLDIKTAAAGKIVLTPFAGSGVDVVLSGAGDFAVNTNQFYVYTSTGNVGINTTTFGTSAAKVLGIGSGTAPTTSPVDINQIWVADRGGVAGKASLHLRTEDGTQHVFGDLVGIGTVTPGALFDVKSPGINDQQLFRTTTSDGINKFRLSTGGTGHGVAEVLNASGAIAIQFHTAAESYFTGGAVGIGTASPNVSALLDVTSTSKGILPPRMTKAQRDAIGTPADGLILYQTNGTAGIKFRIGGAWYTVNVTADP